MMEIIPKSLYPNVPNVAGVPALLRRVSVISTAVTALGFLGASDALSLLIGADPVQWGVFDESGQPVAIADTVVSVEYRNGSRISDYPVEEGAFASYNKVANPYDVRVRMARSGNESQRAEFIEALDEAARSLDLYTIVTPEATYLDANLERWDYRREVKNGTYIIIADLYLREVRQTATADFSEPKSASAADSKSQGQVQAKEVTPAQESSIKKTSTSGASGDWSSGGSSGDW